MDPKEEAANGPEATGSQGDGPKVGRIERQCERERPKWRRRSPAEQTLGKLLIVLTLVSFIFVGLILNLVQLALTVSIRLSGSRAWRRWHKRLMGQLVYAIFSQPVFVLHVWPQWQLDILLEDLRMLEQVREGMLGVIIVNHSFDLDWMVCFMLADHLGQMGNYKCFSKAELKWLPVVGWTFWMADLIYVQRDWKQDRLRIADKLDELLDYDQILLGIFAEGTRWTQAKHADAVAFARGRGLEPYRHHLFPRPRGFNYTLRHYLRRAAPDGRLGGVGPLRLFNLEIIMPDRPRFRDFLAGGQLRAGVYCEEVPLGAELREETLASRDEDDCPKLTRLLRDIYRRKDQLVDEFEAHGQRFPRRGPRSGHFPVKSAAGPFLYWLAGMSLTYGTFAYLASTVLAGSPVFWTLVVGFLASAMLLLRRVERESVAAKSRARPAAGPGERRRTRTPNAADGPDAEGAGRADSGNSSSAC